MPNLTTATLPGSPARHEHEHEPFFRLENQMSKWIRAVLQFGAGVSCSATVLTFSGGGAYTSCMLNPRAFSPASQIIVQSLTSLSAKSMATSRRRHRHIARVRIREDDPGLKTRGAFQPVAGRGEAGGARVVP